VLTAARLPDVQASIAASGFDGWLLFDFKRINPIAGALLGIEGFITRRAFAWIPAEGTPVALQHAIERDVWKRWPTAWESRVYQSWESLESALRSCVGGKHIAMEYSPGNAVPYLDRVPAGVLDLVRSCGATVGSSANLVTQFHVLLSDEDRAAHRAAAEQLAIIADAAFRKAAAAARAGTPLTEYAVQQWILGELAARGLSTDHGPNVSVGPNAANPHYDVTPEGSALITMNSVVLIDLWAQQPDAIYADQTWMATIGTPPDEAKAVWLAVRDARDAAIAAVQAAAASGTPITGAAVDHAARRVIVERGYGEFFIHRTGHSIDPRSLHGSGPNLDGFETNDDRVLLPGVAFSVEPGIYLPGRFGMRSEVNMFITPSGEPVVTPSVPQRELLAL
jgi:Xaa-Pro dipeptidase